MASHLSSPPQRFAVVIFPGFQALDVFGPLDALNILANTTKIDLAIIALSLDPVSTHAPTLSPNPNCAQSVVPTHTFSDPPTEIDVLLVPGGKGTRDPEVDVNSVVEFIRKSFRNIKYLITVCTGAGLAARASVLDRRRATTNKSLWNETIKHGQEVSWIKKARWVKDTSKEGQAETWTSSGISAGIDCMLAFIEEKFGEDVAKSVSVTMEYERHTDSERDPFSEMYNL